ncbi:MAG: hypothetical protein JNK15_12320 [Planctomycetes bacterium]|nr:hypothetical protein [Planctomycetota bacterium]
MPHTLNRIGVQNDIGNPAWVPGTGWLASGAGQLGRVLVYVSGGSGTVLATNTSIGAGCVASYASVYENFATAAGFDLSNTSWQFISTGGGYTIIPGGSFLPVGSVQATPTVLGLGDDTAVTQAFTTGSFPGSTALTVCSNGFVSTNTGNGTGYTPTVATFLSDPAASFRCWHDFNPTLVGSGTVKWEESATVTSITWDGVWDYGGTGAGDASTMQFQFYPNGDVVVAFGSVSLVGTSGTGFLVGYSPAGASADPGNTDWSATSATVLGAADVLPLALSASSRPIIGTSWGMTTSNIPAPTIVVEIIGLSDPGINDLFFIGAPGCGLRANLDLLNAAVVAAPTHAWSFAIPNNIALLNLHLYASSAAFAPVNAFGAITSNGIDGLMGDF